MYKIVIILYITCFSLYLLFSRQPDFFDGEFTTATIHFVRDSSTKELLPKAFFSIGRARYSADAVYVFRQVKEGDTVPVIYEASQPPNAALYSVWGYWIRWGELLGSLILSVALFKIATAITSNPTPEGLISDIESSQPRKRRYDD